MKILTILLVMSSSSVFAQQRSMPPPLHAMSDEIKKEINEQVWSPFMKSYESLDPALFMSVQSEKIVRVMGSMNRIYDHAKYTESTKRIFSMMKSQGSAPRIELSFTNRLVKDDMAYEMGYYCLKSKGSSGEYQNRGFGFFHVMLRKEDKQWKIVMDSDSNVDIDEQTFQSGEVLSLGE